jgi:hypothetical protein
MTVVRKILAIALALLGAQYVVRASATLIALPDVTARWIQLSGDPDFKFDYNLFAICIGVGAAAVLTMGLATAALGIAEAAGREVRNRYWIALAIAAPLIHFPWFLYRRIALGTLPRGQVEIALQPVAVRFAVITAVYMLAWAVMRRWRKAAI